MEEKQALSPEDQEPDRAVQLIAAAEELLTILSKGQALTVPALRTAMVTAFGASDADGVWNWRDVYEGPGTRRAVVCA